jgi:hypothetical protein
MNSKNANTSDSGVATFRNSRYTITTSLNDASVYIKIINNISYMCYEGNFDDASFKMPFSIANIYKLVTNCFDALIKEESTEDSSEDEPTDKYNLDLELDNGVLRLLFHCVVGGFLDVEFDLRLREKLMSNDSQLTINFQRVEQAQLESVNRLDAAIAKIEANFAKKMAEMERRMEALGHADICFTQPSSGQFNNIKSYPIDSKLLTITDGGNHINAESFAKIKYFYQLEVLKMTSCQWNEPNRYTSNATVKKLTINNSPSFSDISFVKNFPSLEDLTMTGFAVDASIVTTLRSIEHKIKRLTFQSCQGINQSEMQIYCTQTGITLSMT